MLYLLIKCCGISIFIHFEKKSFILNEMIMRFHIKISKQNLKRKILLQLGMNRINLSFLVKKKLSFFILINYIPFIFVPSVPFHVYYLER